MKRHWVCFFFFSKFSRGKYYTNSVTSRRKTLSSEIKLILPSAFLTSRDHRGVKPQRCLEYRRITDAPWCVARFEEDKTFSRAMAIYIRADSGVFRERHSIRGFNNPRLISSLGYCLIRRERDRERERRGNIHIYYATVIARAERISRIDSPREIYGYRRRLLHNTRGGTQVRKSLARDLPSRDTHRRRARVNNRDGTFFPGLIALA